MARRNRRQSDGDRWAIDTRDATKASTMLEAKYRCSDALRSPKGFAFAAVFGLSPSSSVPAPSSPDAELFLGTSESESESETLDDRIITLNRKKATPFALVFPPFSRIRYLKSICLTVGDHAVIIPN
ncbi:hypothetical protein ZHAS_00020313 [Anopheles sinensis]|uniref:Uncharacterized protein n=1 Tax=Anopheles sinensis TaxID=74873 RepID=A0A084WPR1_ANOSI|nr:hypothetical protein ZHAS_00020313 [Anopheles sinensis]